MEFANPLGRTIFDRSYAMKDANGNPTETYEQACARVAKFAAMDDPQRQVIEKMLLEQKIVPAGRWWYGAGRDYPQINNCFVIPTGPSLGKFCHDLCITLMTGGGVGVNYSDIPHPTDRKAKASLPFYPEIFISRNHPDFNTLYDQYPHLIKENPEEGGQEIKVGYPVKDSREGWGVAVMRVANALVECKEVALNLSDIRPKGTPIKSFGGVTSGPDALLVMIDGILNVILRTYAKKRTLGPIDYMKVANFVARGVSAGGIRRSAMMGMLLWKHDSIEKFLTCKDYDGDLEVMNISVVIDNTFVKQAKNKNSKAGKLYDKIIKHSCTHGEPGMWNIELARTTVPEALSTNPCGEQSLPAYGNCNLGHINLGVCNTPEEIISSAKTLTEVLINGTLKSKLPLPEFYERMDKDRRIGVGILGLHTWLVRRGKPFSIDAEDEKFFKDLYKTIRDHANKYTKKLRINTPETVTTIAPTGTVSFIVGVTSGIEPMFCAAYLRRYYTGGIDQKIDSQVIIDPLAKECLAKGLKVDDSFTLSVDEHLDVQIKLQNSFVDNSVSKTINLPKVGTFDVEKVKKSVLTALEKGIKGVTLYPSGARGNEPLTPVSLDEALKLEQVAKAKTEATETDCSSGSCSL